MLSRLQISQFMLSQIKTYIIEQLTLFSKAKEKLEIHGSRGFFIVV